MDISKINAEERFDFDMANFLRDLDDLPEYAADWETVPYGEQAEIEIWWSELLHNHLPSLRRRAIAPEQLSRFEMLVEALWAARDQFAAIGVPEDDLARALQIAPVHA